MSKPCLNCAMALLAVGITTVSFSLESTPDRPLFETIDLQTYVGGYKVYKTP